MEKEKSAFLVVDMQNEVVAKLAEEGQKIVSHLQKALSFARKKKMPIFYLVREHRENGLDVEKFRLQLFSKNPFLVEGSKGAEVIKELAPLKEDFLIVKRRFSGFFQTDLLMLLTRLKIDRLILCGLQTPNCVRCTATDAIGYDFSVTILKDATGAKTQEIHNANLLDLENMGILIQTVEEFIGIWQH